MHHIVAPALSAAEYSVTHHVAVPVFAAARYFITDGFHEFILCPQVSIILIGGLKVDWQELGRYPFRISSGEFSPTYSYPALGE